MDYFQGLKRMPLVRLVIPLIAGIIIQHQLDLPVLNINLAGITLALTLAGLFFSNLTRKYHLRWVFGLVLNCFFLICGMCIMERAMNKPAGYHTSYYDPQQYIAIVSSAPSERDSRYRFILRTTSRVTISGATKHSGRLVAWVDKDSIAATLKPGDRIVFHGPVNEITNHGNPFEFDYRRFMMMQGITGVAWINSGEWFVYKRGSEFNPFRSASALRDRLLDIMKNKGITGKEFETGSALLLGYRDELSNETRDAFSASGAMHILAVSGLHVGILYLLLFKLTSGFNLTKRGRIIGSGLHVTIIWIYAFLTGLSPSVTRSATMFSFMALSGGSGRQSVTINNLASSAFIQLLINPLNLYSVGFQLSYMAVAGIVYYQPLIFSWLKFGNGVLRKVWALSSVSLSAQLMVFPLIIYYFNQFPNFFLLTNLFAVPLAMVILYLATIFFSMSFVPLLSDILALLLKTFLFLLNNLTIMVSELPFSNTSGITISLPSLIIVFLAIFSIMHFFRSGKNQFLFLSLLLFITTFSSRAHQLISSSGNQVFIVYNLYPDSVYGFIDGRRKLIVDSKENAFTRAAAIPATVSRAAVYYRTGNIKKFSPFKCIRTVSNSENGNMFINGAFAWFRGVRIYFPQSGDEVNVKSGMLPDVDVVVISAETGNTAAEIFRAIEPRIVVFDSSLGFYQRRNLIDKCQAAGIDYHDVRSSGAFVLNLSDLETR